MLDLHTNENCDSDHITSFFNILEQPGVLRWLFNDLHRFAQQSSSEMERFPELVTTICRFYNFSPILLNAVVHDSVAELSGPALMFRGDHLRTRVLREFISQSLGSTLTSYLEPLIKTLAVPPLSEAELSQTARLLIDRLLSFRFPSEFNAYLGAITETVSQKFPEMERIGISILFFLRYLFPLVLNLPEQFHLEMSPEYQTNTLRLIKRLQPLAAGELPSDLFPFNTEPYKEALDAFFSRLSLPATIPRSFVLCTVAPPDAAVKDFFELVTRFSQSSIAQCGIASLPATTREQWSRFFIDYPSLFPSHSSDQRVPSCSSSLSPRKTNRRSYFNLFSNFSPSSSTKTFGFHKQLGSVQVEDPLPSATSSKSQTHFSSATRASLHITRAGRSQSDTSLEAGRLPVMLDCTYVGDDRELHWGVGSLSLTAIFRRFEDCFGNPTTFQMLELELHYFIGCHALFIKFDDLLDYLLNHYLPTHQELGSLFISALITIWIGCDPRLSAVHSRISPYLSGNDPHSELDRPATVTITQDPQHAFSLQTISITERRSFRKLFFRMDLSDSAKNLQDAHLYYYQKVYPWDLIDSLRSKPDSVCREVATHFNNTVAWIQTTCLQPTDEQKRVNRINRWIAIGYACYLACFLSPLLMIQTALSNQVISRLRSTWSRVPQTLLDYFEEIQKVCSPAHNYVTLRNIAITKNADLPLVIISRDIATAVELANIHGEISPQPIPYDRCRQVGQLAHRAGLLRPVRPDEREYTLLFGLLSDPVPRFGEEKLYQLSYLHEPPRRGSIETQLRIPNPLHGGGGRLRSAADAEM